MMTKWVGAGEDAEPQGLRRVGGLESQHACLWADDPRV